MFRRRSHPRWPWASASTSPCTSWFRPRDELGRHGHRVRRHGGGIGLRGARVFLWLTHPSMAGQLDRDCHDLERACGDLHHSCGDPEMQAEVHLQAGFDFTSEVLSRSHVLRMPIHESSGASATLNQPLGSITVSYIADRSSQLRLPDGTSGHSRSNLQLI